MMDGGIGIIIVSTLGLFALTGAACMACCCCFCAFPLYKLFSYICGFFRSTRTNTKHPKQTEEQLSDSAYQMVNTSDISHYLEDGSNRGNILPSAAATVTYAGSDEQLAHAYLVPPLVDVHTSNSDLVIGEHVAALSNPNISSGNSDQRESVDDKEGCSRFKDLWAAFLFLLNVAVVYYFGVQSLYVSGDFAGTVGTESEVSMLGAVVIFTVVLSLFASLVGSVGLAFMVRHADSIIEFIMSANIAMLVAVTVCSLLTFQIIAAIIFGVFACLNYWYLQSVRSRIPFASAVLNIAAKVLRDNYTGLLVTSYSALVVQVVWFLLWSAALTGILKVLSQSEEGNIEADDGDTGASKEEGDDDFDSTQTANGGVLFLALLSLFWGIQMVQSVVQTTVCGTLACWWFQPQREAPVRGSAFRALTTSVGSLCLGSLIVAFVQALRELLHMMRTQAQRSHGRHHRSNGLAVCVIGLTECLLRYVEEAVRYFNKYAFCYVAAYGLGFVESGKQVTSLFTRRYVESELGF